MVRIPGSHEPNNKNRSSKHLYILTGYRSVFKTMNNAALSKCNCAEAQRELKRRQNKRAKKEATSK